MDLLNAKRRPDQKFKAELQVLGESVKHHVNEEESKVFAVARDYLSAAELDAIGEAWEKAGYIQSMARKKKTSHTKTSRKKSTRKGKYSKGASRKVARAVRKKKAGTLKSGRSKKKVKSRKQAIAIGLSEARERGARVPKKKSRKKST